MATGNYGKALHYNNFCSFSGINNSELFYDTFGQYNTILTGRIGDWARVIYCNNIDILSYEDLGDYIHIVFSKVLSNFFNVRTLERYNNFTIDYYKDLLSDETYKFYKFTDNNGNVLFSLPPHKLNIINDGEGTITNSVNTEPYKSSQIYYDNQPITLTYDNTEGDFKCWYDENNQRILSKELSYSFNITEDTTITLKTNSGAIGEISRDSEFRKILYPKTKVEAITDDDETPLTSILNSKAGIDDLKDYSRTIKITDTSIILAELKDIVDEVNENGEHVFFDFSELGSRMYLCTVLMGEDSVEVKDIINSKIAKADYDGTMLLEDLLDTVSDYAVPYKKLTVDCISTLGNPPIGITIKVYNMFEETETLLYERVYDGNPMEFLIQPYTKIKVNGVDNYPFVKVPEEVFLLTDNVNLELEVYEVGSKSSVADIHTLLEYDVAEQALEIGDEINMNWTATNGTTYNLKPRVAGIFNVVNHETGQPVKAVCMQILTGLPESVQFDAGEREKPTEETARAGIYYYGYKNDTYSYLDLEEGDTIPYSDYSAIYYNSFKDTTARIPWDGNNLLEYSAYLQYLNSSESKGNWWHSTHEGDTKPGQANTVNGFLYGLEQNDLQYILDHNFSVEQNSVITEGGLKTLHAKFRPLTAVEIYGVSRIEGEGLGTYLPIWKELCNNASSSPLSNPSNGNCGARKISNISGTGLFDALIAFTPYNSSYSMYTTSLVNGAIANNTVAQINQNCAPLFFIY